MKVIIIKKKLLIPVLLILFVSIIYLAYQNTSSSTFFIQGNEEPIRQGNPESNKMAFTCNVDWGNEEIPKILKILEEKNIKITFFVSGRWAKNNPELLTLMHSNGHEIGNHGYSHKAHSKISRQQNYEEIKKTDDIIFEILNMNSIYFAPPSGDFNQTTLEVAKSLGYKTILWNIDTIDWREGSTASIIEQRVMSKEHAGAILLMHPKPATVEALPTIIDKILAKGIRIGTVSYLLE